MATKKVKAKQDKDSYEVITQVDEETGDLLLPIPPELMDRMGWTTGTEIEFDVDKTGRIIMRKAT